MSELRPLRLLNAIENGTVLGAEFNTFLTDPGRLAEFTVLFAQRGQAKRIANGQTTMTAMVNSIIAINAAFVQATKTNDTIVEEIVKSALAMSTIANFPDVLEKASDNLISWGYVTGSIYYENHIKNIIAHLSGVDPSLYGTTSLLILDPVSMGDISVSERGMRALVNSIPSSTIMAGSSVAMALVAANVVAINLVAQQTSIMPIIANSVFAMNEIVSRSTATSLMASNLGAIQAIASNPTAFLNYTSGSFYALNLKTVVANLAGLTPANYLDLGEILTDPTDALAVANSKSAIQAILANPAAINTMLSSTNLDVILGSSIAMTEITGNESTMNTLISNTTAFPILLTSSAAKAAIFASPTLVSTMLTGVDSSATVGALAQSATVTNNASFATYKSVGIAGNIIILTGVMGSIVATTLQNQFQSGDDAGTRSPIFNIPGTSLASGPIDINLPFTNAKWTVNSIAATAAANINITYVDFN
tara:strand:- start:3732 stop:5168 length:1437 start_codon:yes stop_codon:yes gene_type:complete